METLGYNYVILSENDIKYGVVETHSDAKIYAELFKRNRNKLNRIIFLN